MISIRFICNISYSSRTPLSKPLSSLFSQTPQSCTRRSRCASARRRRCRDCRLIRWHIIPIRRPSLVSCCCAYPIFSARVRWVGPLNTIQYINYILMLSLFAVGQGNVNDQDARRRRLQFADGAATRRTLTIVVGHGTHKFYND